VRAARYCGVRLVTPKHIDMARSRVAHRQPLQVVAVDDEGTVPHVFFAGDNEAAAAYYGRILDYAQRIRGTTELGEIVRLLDRALGETRALHEVAALAAAHRQVAAAEARIDELKREVETTSSLLYLDHLTGALNRRGLNDAYLREAARADRSGRPLALGMLDLDDFKQLNDRLGHAAGDRALVHVANILRTALRPQDTIARYGGEEFVVLLPETSPEAARAAINRAREALVAAPLESNGRKLDLAFSAGIAACIGDQTFDTLLARADSALYTAKRGGKNQVHIAP